MFQHTPLPPPRHKHQLTLILLVKNLHPQPPLIPLLIPITHQRHPPQALPAPQHLIHRPQQPSTQSLPLILFQNIDISQIRNSNMIRNESRQADLLRSSPS
jgi:hypothetical protein